MKQLLPTLVNVSDDWKTIFCLRNENSGWQKFTKIALQKNRNPLTASLPGLPDGIFSKQTAKFG
jgi:hypothetical protein